MYILKIIFEVLLIKNESFKWDFIFLNSFINKIVIINFKIRSIVVFNYNWILNVNK